MRIALLGCGAIGGAVADAVIAGDLPGIQVVMVVTRSSPPAQLGALGATWSACPDDLLTSNAEVVLEAAGPSVVRRYALPLINAGKHLIVMSVSSLVHAEFQRQLVRAAEANHCDVIVSAGAIGGLDILRAARQRGALDQVTFTTAKHPRGLAGAPYITDNQIDLPAIQSRELVFEGTAEQAVTAFPQNVNVAAAVSLAGLGFQRTVVRVIADPALQQTTHTLEASGGFGTLRLQIESAPHPSNPRTSYMACLGAMATLAQCQSRFKVGG
jgi:aspartate dehydrogenase